MSLRYLPALGLILCLLLALGAFPNSTTLAAGNIVVNDPSDTLHSPGCATTGTGTCSLRDLITYANTIAGADTITFNITGTITLGAVLPTINDTLTIDGPGMDLLTVDGAGDTKLFVVQGTLNVKGITLKNAKCDSQSGGGGGITNFGTLNVNQSRLEGNDSTDCLGGGGIDNQGGTVNVTNSTFSENVAERGGGAIQNSGSLTVTGSMFQSNSKSDSFSNIGGSGGAIYNRDGGNATITNSTLSGNTSKNQGDGGAVANSGDGTLTVKHSNFLANSSDNSGGAIWNDSGTLTVMSTLFEQNNSYEGGAVYIGRGSATISKSTFLGNEGYDEGGGIYLDEGNLTVRSSTFSGNQGEIGGGGIYVDNPASLVVANSTFTGNTAKPYGNGGAIYNWEGEVRVTNSTIYSNGVANLIHHAGGIYNYSGNVTLRNTIVANNAEYACYSDGGSISADHFNLDDDGSCGNATQVTLTQLALGPLQNNGGPTKTMALGAASAALGAGDNNVCSAAIGPQNYGAGAKDQRGLARPQGQNCDTGAYESNTQFGPGFVVNDTADTDDGTCATFVAGFSNCTLREAINAANIRNGSDKITFEMGAGIGGCTAANKCTVALTSILPVITSKVTLDGSANEGNITLNGANDNLILAVNSNARLNLNALSLANGRCNCATGGGILNYGGLNVTNSTFSGNTAVGGDGSGISNHGTATVTNSTFSGNAGTPRSYTGIYNAADSTLNVTNTTLAGNNGYGILTQGGTAKLRNTIVASNSADCQNQGGSLTANRYNLDTDGSCGDATTKTDQQIALGPLQNNGGPTQTIKPGAGSAAIGAGKNGVCAAAVGPSDYGAGGFDQRGVKRPQGENCDVGAFEVRVK